MYAARVRASLKPLFHGRHSSSLRRNCEMAAISRRILPDRFMDGERTVSSLRLPGNGVGIKHFYRAFHSTPQCYTSESDDVGVKTNTAALFSSLEDDCFSELGSVEKDGKRNMVLKLLTEMPEPEPSQKTKGKKKKKKKKKHEQASDSISKLKLLTEKPEVPWKTNGKKKAEAHASSPARNVTDSNVSFSKPSKSSSPIPDHESKAQNTISPSMCSSIGPLEGRARVNEDTVDVLFQARNLNEADSILEKPNDATLDQMGMRISSCFEDFEKQLAMRRILAKDLEVLLHSVMHLENHPMAPEGTKALAYSHDA